MCVCVYCVCGCVYCVCVWMSCVYVCVCECLSVMHLVLLRFFGVVCV